MHATPTQSTALFQVTLRLTVLRLNPTNGSAFAVESFSTDGHTILLSEIFTSNASLDLLPHREREPIQTRCVNVSRNRLFERSTTPVHETAVGEAPEHESFRLAALLFCCSLCSSPLPAAQSTANHPRPPPCPMLRKPQPRPLPNAGACQVRYQGGARRRHRTRQGASHVAGFGAQGCAASG